MFPGSLNPGNEVVESLCCMRERTASGRTLPWLVISTGGDFTVTFVTYTNVSQPGVRELNGFCTRAPQVEKHFGRGP